MGAPNAGVTSSTSVSTTPAFWERLWRQSGILSRRPATRSGW
jgi:hypothetical protein